MKKVKFHWSNGSYLVLLILLHSVITSFLALKLNIWRDEAYTLNTTAGSFLNAFKQSLNFEGQPPVYFILIWLWRQISNYYIFARFFSVISVSASIYFFHLLVNRFVKGKNVNILIALYAFNPFVIWSALEIRHYGFSLLLTSILVYLFYEVFIFKHKTPLQNKVLLIIYIIISIISINTYYFFGILLFVNGIVLLFQQKYRNFIIYSILMIIPILSVSYLFGYLDSQIGDHDHRISLYSNLLNFEADFYYYTSLDIVYSINKFFKYLIRLIVFSFIVFCVFKTKFSLKPDNKKIEKNYFFVQLVVSAVLFLIIRYAMQIQLYYKHMFIVFYFTLLTVFLGIDTIKNSLWRTIAICILILYCFKITEEYRPPFIKGVEDYVSLANFIEKNEIADEPILIYLNGVAEPLYYHYKGLNLLYPLPAKISDYDNIIENKETLDSLLSHVVPYSQTYWFVTDGASDVDGYETNIDMIDSFFVENFNIDKEINFKIKGDKDLNYLRLKKMSRKVE